MNAKNFSRFAKNSPSSTLTAGSILPNADNCLLQSLLTCLRAKVEQRWIVAFHEAGAGVLYPDAGFKVALASLKSLSRSGFVNQYASGLGLSKRSLLTSRSHCIRAKVSGGNTPSLAEKSSVSNFKPAQCFVDVFKRCEEFAADFKVVFVSAVSKPWKIWFLNYLPNLA